MAYSVTEYTLDGITTSFSCNFPVIAKEDIYVTLNGEVLNETTDYNIIDFNSFGDIPTVELLTGSVGEGLKIQRITNINQLVTEFSNGAVLFLKDDLNKVNLQLLYALQEYDDRVNNYINRISGNNTMNQNLDMNNFRIINLSDAIDTGDAVNLRQVLDIFNEIIGNTPENPFSGIGYQIGQTAISSNDLTQNNDFIFVDRSNINFVNTSLYQEFNSVTNYDDIGGFIELPIIEPLDNYTKYYTRIY